ncbi:hypothetical protein F5Y17DRAFT_434190 [Xylariaceae sp. FL0594]|nr:hypothetical protein F5Y17DRAFT_434190 [Xylariaceae sp. FL0594]
MSSSPLKSIEQMGDGEPSLPPLASLDPHGPRGVKRPAPSLLPAFELSSSPGLPKPSKRPFREDMRLSSAFLKYPTPIPTSSTGILSSSPPPAQSSRRPLTRTLSTVSERAPLSHVPELYLNENGETLCMGRSSNSSHYQLSTNRLISRVHVKARYIPADTDLALPSVEIVCNGWNGLKLHCQERTWELGKGDTFRSETENAVMMIDVQDARVIVHWPKRHCQDSLATLSDSSWDDSPRSLLRAAGPASDLLHSSPLQHKRRLHSPESPTPAGKSAAPSGLDGPLGDEDASDASEAVQIYEDASGDEQDLPAPALDAGTSFAQTVLNESFSSDLSDPEDNDPDEENDPIIHSFGPFGADLTNRLAAITAKSPKQPSRLACDPATAKASLEPEELLSPSLDVAAITNHVINQLAFSRLSSNPLTTILNNLPADEKKDLSKSQLRRIMEATRCIGVIARQGKDAAGKPLESEYYYIPEHDDDDSRRIAVTDGLRKPSLRACRKQHKQYYWKRPKTP